jgi:hypothetical protein
MIIYRAHSRPALAGTTPLQYLFTFCRHHGLSVTSGERITADGAEVVPHVGHARGSLHYIGHAVDVSVAGLEPAVVMHVISQANALGVNVIDERNDPADGTPWTAPHLHLSISPAGTRLV